MMLREGFTFPSCIDKTMTLAYIVGGIVLIAFVAAMSILIFLCQRYVHEWLKTCKMVSLFRIFI